MVENYMEDLFKRIEPLVNPQATMGPKVPPPPPRGLVKPPKPIALSKLQQKPAEIPSKYGFIEGQNGVPTNNQER